MKPFASNQQRMHGVIIKPGKVTSMQLFRVHGSDTKVNLLIIARSYAGAIHFTLRLWASWLV
jgi:hypothetical protein